MFVYGIGGCGRGLDAPAHDSALTNVVPSGPSHHPADFPSLYRTFPVPFVTYPEDGPITDEKMDSPDHGLTNERTDLLDGLTQSLPVLLDLALLYHCSSYLYPCSLLFGVLCLCPW